MPHVSCTVSTFPSCPLLQDVDHIVGVLEGLDGVHKAQVELRQCTVRVDGTASDVELLHALEKIGKVARIVTHTRAVRTQPQPTSSASQLKVTRISTAVLF